MRALWSDSAVALGSRSTGLCNMIRQPRARFHVAKWGGFVIKTGYKVALPALSKFNLTVPSQLYLVTSFVWKEQVGAIKITDGNGMRQNPPTRLMQQEPTRFFGQAVWGTNT